MLVTSYALVAETRRKELKTRVGLAAFIGATAMLLAPSVWPLIWFGLVIATQVLDWFIFRPVRENPTAEPTRSRRLICCISASLTVVVYSAISAYMWLQGGQAGQLFAVIQVAGGMLHVSLHMYPSRPLLLSAVIPHGLYFLGLPLVEALRLADWGELLVSVAGVLFIAHLVAAVKASSATTSALRAATNEAEGHRRVAEDANAAKSDFLAVVSHEIRTPMNAVISSANLLRRTRLDAQQQEHVAMLIDAGDVLVALLNDVLDFSKIEAGKMTLEAADVDLRDKLGGVERMWTSKALAKGVDLTVVIDATVPETVRTDPLRLQQIMFNLLSNAVKFTDQGTIQVQVGWVQGPVLTLDVSDTGCGIPADRLDQVFASFEQADAGTTRRYGGTGLGLAISRRIAEIMGGGLTVESLEGHGSTFRLRLPVEVVVSSAPAGACSYPEQIADLSGFRILAAEDHPVNQRILTLLLAPMGCELTVVSNGAEAVEAAASQHYDAILMDMQMPVMDGVEAGTQIRRSGANRSTPIISLTANAMDTHRAAWDPVGVSAFLTKPIDPTLLCQALSRACSEADAEPEMAEAV